MAYDNIVSRTDAQALMPEEVFNDLVTHVEKQSASLSLFKHIKMARGQSRLPVLAALPTAYFVDGDTGLKQTSESNWSNKYLNAEEIAVIVPIPDAVLEDLEMDVWDSSLPLIGESIGRTLDAAIFFSVNKPASWPTAIIPAAVAAGNVVARGTASAANGGIAGDISSLFATIEADGFDVNGVAAVRSYRGSLRNARDTQGRRLEELSPDQVYGEDVIYPMRGLWPTGLSAAEMVAGDYTNGILGIRRDITMDRSQEAIIQDNTGAIIYNAFQQDITLIRFTFRAAFQVANLINYDQQVEADRYPFGVLRSPAA